MPLSFKRLSAFTVRDFLLVDYSQFPRVPFRLFHPYVYMIYNPSNYPFVPMVISCWLVACSLLSLNFFLVVCRIFSSFSVHFKKPFIWFEAKNIIYRDNTLVPFIREPFRPLNFVSRLPADMCDGATPARGYNWCVDVGYKQPIILSTVEFSAVSVCLGYTLIYPMPDMHIQPSRNIVLMLKFWLFRTLNSELTNLLNRVFLVHIFRFVVTQCSLIIINDNI